MGQAVVQSQPARGANRISSIFCELLAAVLAALLGVKSTIASGGQSNLVTNTCWYLNAHLNDTVL
jgi:hypothetical protein